MPSHESQGLASDSIPALIIPPSIIGGSIIPSSDRAPPALNVTIAKANQTVAAKRTM